MVSETTLSRMKLRRSSSSSMTLSASIIALMPALALQSANAGIKAMMDALNVIDDEEERRSFIRLNVVSLALHAGAIVFLLLAIGAVVAFRW